MNKLKTAALALGILLIGAATEAGAQEVSLAAARGLTSYDLSGTGTAELWAVRARFAAGPVLLEPGVAFFDYRSQGEDERTVILPEVTAQVGYAWSRLRPYAGVGVGVGHTRSDATDATATDLTLSAAGGVDLSLSPLLAINAEGRVRAIDPWTATTADLTAGLVLRF